MGVYMPLAEGLNHVLFDGVPAQEMARTLMMGEQSSDVEFILPREAVQQAHRDQAPHNHASKNQASKNQVSKGNGGRNA
ncbi:hypothetical protein [Halomonas sp. PA16-9]